MLFLKDYSRSLVLQAISYGEQDLLKKKILEKIVQHFKEIAVLKFT